MFSVTYPNEKMKPNAYHPLWGFGRHGNMFGNTVQMHGLSHKQPMRCSKLVSRALQVSGMCCISGLNAIIPGGCIVRAYLGQLLYALRGTLLNKLATVSPLLADGP